MLPINPRIVEVTTETLQHYGIPYGWGHKVNPSLDLPDFEKFGHAHGIDCSGFVDWMSRFASNEVVRFPEGSIAIGEYLHRLAIKGYVSPAHYNLDCSVANGDLYICGFDHGGQDRHVFFVCNKLTCESHGHTTGVSRRPYNHSAIYPKVQWCYRVAKSALAVAKNHAGIPVGAVEKVNESSSAMASLEFPGKIVSFDRNGQKKWTLINSFGHTKSGQGMVSREAFAKLAFGFTVGELNGNLVLKQNTVGN